MEYKTWRIEEFDGWIEAHCPTCGRGAREDEYTGKPMITNFCPHCGEQLRYFDVTGAELAPGDPEHCHGNGEHPDFECCCDECDYLMLCLEAEKKDE